MDMIKKLKENLIKSKEEHQKLLIRKKEIEMLGQELTFKITNMYTQRSMGGRTNLSAKCIQDNISVDIEVKNSEMVDKSLIRQKLIEEHDRILKLEEKHKDDIGVGTML